MLKRNESEDKIEIVKQPEHQKKQVFLGHGGLKTGHVLWQYDTKTFELSNAEIETVSAKYNETVKTNNIAYYAKHKMKSVGKVVTKKDCFYFGALNRKNAIKILNNKYNIFEIK